MRMQSAWQLWWMFRKQAARSLLMRCAAFSRGAYIGEGARIPGRGRLEFARSSSVQRYAVLNATAGAVIRMGQGARVGAFAVISAMREVDIGTDVLIADRVFISDHHHGFADPNAPVIAQSATAAQPVSIGAGSWLGINVCIMPGVVLGPGCIVGAGAVVTRSFPAGSIIAGVPATLLRQRADHGP
jgi:acetyltransferase-like isoleucine patch superfamily enzyme